MGKLVRDRIPAIIESAGGIPKVKILGDAAFHRALHVKLSEEVKELRSARLPEDVLEEAADVLEVLRSIVNLYGATLEDVIETADKKKGVRGGFDLRLWLDKAPSRAAATFQVEDYLEPLESGDAHRFGDWPNSPIENVAAGVYTIWEGDAFVYVGFAGRNLTTRDIANADQSNSKATGLRDRLDHHASGARSGDQFCVYVCDQYVLSNLSPDDRDRIRDGDLRLLNARTREHIRGNYKYRYVTTPDGETAQILERAVQRGALNGNKPLLNPL